MMPYKNKPVGTYAKMAVTKFLHQASGGRKLQTLIVYYNEIVAGAVKLHEVHVTLRIPPAFAYREAPTAAIAPANAEDATPEANLAKGIRLTGQLATVTDHAGNVWSYEYDLRGRQIEKNDPDTGTTQLTYDDAGQLTSSSDPLARVTYHDSCSGLRELGVERQPRTLLATVAGLELAEMGEAQICCGFGGTFCVKYPDISNDMLEKKAASIARSGAEVVLAGDLGCLMNMAGKLKRLHSPVESRHVAEVLAGLADGPAIGEA